MNPYKKETKWTRRRLAYVAIAMLIIVVGLHSLLSLETTMLPVFLLPPATSVLHPKTLTQPPLNPAISFSIETIIDQFTEYSESFPQHGKAEPGQHYRIENTNALAHKENREIDSLLLITVYNDSVSWGTNHNVSGFFNLLDSLDYPKEKMSIVLLTSSASEFLRVKQVFRDLIFQYSQLSVIFRNDFSLEGLDRENRHEDERQADRRRMIARYRNYALFTTMQSWHQHVVWLDADIVSIPARLLSKMAHSGLDIVHPLCARRPSGGDWYIYDRNAWVGHRKFRSTLSKQFVPGPLNSKNMQDLYGEKDSIVPLDSVGGAMLYVRADVHRQGVSFPVHYIIGSEWEREGYDGIETEGLCYTAHFLGFKCWGMPKEIIYHSE